MGRPTIRDLAETAGVSVSTVNRVIGGQAKVRDDTARLVLEAAREIGFYGAPAIHDRLARPRQRLGALLLQRGRAFYRALALELERAAEEHHVDLDIAYLDDLSPEHVAASMLKLGEWSEAMVVVTAEHPLVNEAIEQLLAKNIGVFGLISPLAQRFQNRFVGLDSYKVGRTAAWAFHRLCPSPGKIGILVGSHRYRCQEMNEIGFRSYFREYDNGFTLLEPLSTFESSAVAREMTERMLEAHDDLQGLFISGGGITGALAALRDSGRGENIVAIGYELIDVTKAALLDGTLDIAIAHPLPRLADAAIRCMSNSTTQGEPTHVLPFEIYTRENI